MLTEGLEFEDVELEVLPLELPELELEFDEVGTYNLCEAEWS